MNMWKSCFEILILAYGWVFSTLSFVHGSPTNHGIHHFEPLVLESDMIWDQHHRTKRDAGSRLNLNIKAFNREFRLDLIPNTDVLSGDVIFETTKKPYNYDTSRVYYGKDLEEPHSIVHGIITRSGLFQGNIVHENETYIIEKSARYFVNPPQFNTIIYRFSDVKPFKSKSFCGSENITSNFHTDKAQHHYHSKNFETVQQRYRRKRAIDPAKVVCELYMQADHRYYQQFYSNTETVIEQIINHVAAMNVIFGAVDFDGDGSADNIGFIIKRLKVYTDPAAAGYKFVDNNYSVEKFLDVHSSENYNAFCLSILLTNQDFNNGVLGLAWTAGSGQAGGVCETYRSYQGESKSLNAAIVTTKNYGSDVSTAVTQVTLAHELGHNFGSGHDSQGDTTCAPGGDGGNFIMYPMATSGFLPNNKLFSSCSITAMGSILEAKARSSSGCFTETQSSICGNKVVEDTEQCDCGWDDECTDACCNPQSASPGANTPCQRTSGSACSPSEGPCCSSSCTLYTAGDSHNCRTNTTCMSESTSCPASQSKPNGTTCDTDLVCLLGECIGSPCLAASLEPCQCIPAKADDYSDANLCKLCCMVGNVCTLSDEIAQVADSNVQPGTPCNGFKGYCDVFKQCKKVDASGPLSKLTDLIFGGEIIETLKTFLTKHWYIGIGAGVLLFILIALVVKFCSKSHGPSKDKVNRISPDPSEMRQHISRTGRNKY